MKTYKDLFSSINTLEKKDVIGHKIGQKHLSNLKRTEPEKKDRGELKW